MNKNIFSDIETKNSTQLVIRKDDINITFLITIDSIDDFYNSKGLNYNSLERCINILIGEMRYVIKKENVSNSYAIHTNDFGIEVRMYSDEKIIQKQAYDLIHYLSNNPIAHWVIKKYFKI